MGICFEHVPLFRWRGCWHYDSGDVMEHCENCIVANTESDCPFDCEEAAQGFFCREYVGSVWGHYSPETADAPNNIPVGRAYPARNDKPIGIAVDSAGNVEIAPPGILPLFSGFRMPHSRKGWICPRCDNAVSPDEKTCPNCKPKPKQENSDGKPTRITE